MPSPLAPMPLLALPLAAVLALPATKPCAPPLGVSAETLFSRAQVARRLAGTQAVTLDGSSCINIAVRTPGTQRLIELLLRGVEVPAEAVRFQVDSAAGPRGMSRRT